MKSNFYYRTLAVLVVASLLAACSAATKEDDKKARLESLKAEQAELSKEIAKLEEEIAKENPDSSNVKSKDVGVTELALKKFNHYVQTQATVESENNILISAKAAGTVTHVYANEGDQVSKGQTIAQIDNSIIMRSIESMKSQLELATSVYERQKNLWNQKIGTEVQYLQAKTSKESLEKQIASLQEQNELTKIKSTISGTIDAMMIKQGENVAPGMPAVRVVNGADLKLTAKISEAYVTRVKKGNKVLVNVSELNREIPATVTFAGRTIDPLSRTFDVEVKLPSDPDLRPNMTATAKVIFHTANEALVIPINVIQEINDEKVVYIAEPKGNRTVAVRKVVTVDGVYGGMAQVKGLNAGDKVITVGYQGLNDGDNIKI
ncbi:MAG TPA: efflux RND transporter periplasmic adaptor subunit [Chryseosolibacter sp.]